MGATSWPSQGAALTARLGPDIQVTYEGFLAFFEGMTADGERWLSSLHNGQMKIGRAYVVEHRYAGAIVESLLNDGLRLAGR